MGGGSLQCRRGMLVILWMSLVDVAFVSINQPFIVLTETKFSPIGRSSSVGDFVDVVAGG